MKVRIGIGLGRTSDPAGLEQVSQGIVECGFDSLWLSEILTSGAPDPLIGLAYVAARYPTLKIGTTMLGPGRNPVRLAKALATLDQLSSGRLLVTLVPGLTEPPERDAIGIEVADRGRALDELLPLLRALWGGDAVSYDGPLGSFEEVRLSPTPHQEPLEIWLGGFARRSLERCGLLGDGWLPSLCPPGEARAGKDVIDEVAARAGRTISPEHFGVSVAYLPDTAREVPTALRRRSRAPLPAGYRELRKALEDYLEVGFSKFVLRPAVLDGSWSEELGRLANAVGDLQS